MNGPDVVAVCCTHFPHILVWKRENPPEVRTGVKKNWKEIWPYFCQILLNSSSKLACSRSATMMSIKNIFDSKQSQNKQTKSVNIWRNQNQNHILPTRCECQGRALPCPPPVQWRVLAGWFWNKFSLGFYIFTKHCWIQEHSQLECWVVLRSTDRLAWWPPAMDIRTPGPKLEEDTDTETFLNITKGFIWISEFSPLDTDDFTASASRKFR